VGAIYRDTLELEVQVWLASPGFADRVGGLAAVYARGNDNVPAWRAEIAALRAQGLEPIPQPRFFGQLYWIISYICGQIISRDDEAYAQCAQPKLIEKAPLLPLIGGNVFANIPIAVGGVAGSTGGGSSGGGSAATQQLKAELEREKAQKRAIQQELEKAKREQTAAAVDELAPFRQTLCITDENTKGPKTQRALMLFKAAINEKLTISVTDQLNEIERNKLIEASKKFSKCGRDTNTPPRNGFEVGLYAFNRAESIVGVVTKAFTKAKTDSPASFPGMDGTVTMDAAITALRKFYDLAPIDNMPLQELDDRVWQRMRG
jgi:hypothetical protein